ncbi:MAG: hypothetical protein J7518_20540 [Nocardioidaceae bacterium]|nr:hypothetical protein [Nocardioidaceae bacterium]
MAALATVAVVVAAAIVWLTTRGSAAAAPYEDPASIGTLTLCDAAGKPVISGSTSAAPFVARVVSSTAAAGPYAVAGRTATLFAHQPREGADPAEWSGQQLTAAARYTDPAHPMAQATVKDVALADFLAAFPPRWHGSVQLRLALAAPDAPPSGHYASLDLKVDGRHWQVVGTPGTASCTTGDATSTETLLDPSVTSATRP